MNKPKTMTQEQFDGLQRGDIVCNVMTPETHYIVTANYGDRVTAVKTVDVTYPSEWVLKIKANK